jgi:hypothetical protein
VEHCKHGERTETRRLQTTNRCNHLLDWPGLQQVCREERTVRRGKELSTQMAYAITSLSLLCATPRRLLRLWRGHWDIENRSHYVRDVTLGEDACRVRSGNAPQLLAALRNAVISLLHARRARNLAAAIRNLAWRPAVAVQLVGVPGFR